MDEPILDAGLDDVLERPQSVEYAGFWIRVGATLLDSLILIPLVALNFYNLLKLKSLPLMILITVLSVLYKPWLEWKKSATLGKMAVGIKVVDEGMGNISGAQALQRFFPWIITYVLSTMTNIHIFSLDAFQETTDFMEFSLMMQDTPYSMITNIYNFIFLIIVVVVAFDSKKQGLHDKFAKTYCIKKNK